MGGIARNDQELMALLMKDFLPVTKETGDNVLTQVQQSIDTNVYDVYMPTKYNRLYMSGGFIGRWINEAGQNGPNEIDSTVFSDPFMMEYNPSEFQHGNESTDRRTEMSEDIRYGKGYDFGFNSERDFWTPIEEWISSGELDGVFETMMTRHGVQWIKI